ncbi:hypothetical protein QYF61_008841 [Mycteria americana]|uniref:Integrase catalytic domain-containing protein n=1 Tax=Mycteria americana TaxID=33587 RepID=A0AAN7MQC0_MYCAM|nr:hypothetical protein QYF61_008841 [Mycteria americana]
MGERIGRAKVTVPSTRVHTGVPACPVQQHRNSSDALAICQPRRIAIAVIKMFPGTAETQWWKQPLDAWKHILCPMPPPGKLSWALKSKSYGTPERIEPENGTPFRNNLIDTWAKEHGIEWVYHIPYHAPASRKIE